MTRRQVLILAILGVLTLAMSLDVFYLKGRFFDDFNDGFGARVTQKRVVPGLH